MSRPFGSGGYRSQDIALYPVITATLKPWPMVDTLRDAVKIFADLLSGYGTEQSKIRRIERRYRRDVST